MGKTVSLYISPGFYVLTALALLTIPLRWLLAWTAAAAVHECFHIIAVRLCGGRIHHVALKVTGAQIISSPLRHMETAICALSGPLGNLLLLLTGRWMPFLAIASLIQCTFNLLPLEDLDGGRGLRALLSMVFPEKRAGFICKIVHTLTLGWILFILGFLLFDKSLGWIPVFCLGIAVIARISQKSLANRERNR